MDSQPISPSDSDAAGSVAPELRHACDHSNPQQCQHQTISNVFVSKEEVLSRKIDDTLIKAVFPFPPSRQKVLEALGEEQTLKLIGQALPVDDFKNQELGIQRSLEQKQLNIGFVPITCATPIIMAEAMGFYRRHDLQVQLCKAEGWPTVRDWAVQSQVEASHMLCPMPLAISLGMEDFKEPFVMPAVEDNNGSALTLHRRYADIVEGQQLRGLTLAIPYRYSMHNYLLRYYLAEMGLHPDSDVRIVECPPPQMLKALERGDVDGYFAPDPFNQRAVYDGIGFIFLLSKDIWDGHPCCAFSVSQHFIEKSPNTFHALYNSIVDATLFCSSPSNRKHISRVVAEEKYLHQPVELLEQILVGDYPDGRGNTRHDHRRIDFDPFPWQSMAVWILTQMKRWNQIDKNFNYRDVAEQVYLAEACNRQIEHLGYKKRSRNYRSHTIMGKTFDPFKAEQYEVGFSIRTLPSDSLEAH
jgi:nitrate/nitrite transport system substrate-binding protein